MVTPYRSDRRRGGAVVAAVLIEKSSDVPKRDDITG
jgi:hypothetical protein